MRTTLEIDDEVLESAGELARQEGVSTGVMVSRLLHQALAERTRAIGQGEHPDDKGGGLRRARRRGQPTDSHVVERIRHEEGL